jgi:Fe-S-cluster containining protein
MTEQKKFRYPKVACSRCGDCCRIPIVPVTHKDVARLVKLTGKPVSKIVRFCSSDEMSYDDESGLWITFRSGKYAMVLRKKKSGECIVQTADHACAVYAARPQTCRTFPYSVEFEDDSVKVVEKITLNKVMKCNAKKCASIDIETLVNNARWESKEDKAYHRLIKRWNGKSLKSDGKGRISDFLRFIGF